MILHESVAAVVFLTRPRAQLLATITMRKSIHGFPLRSFMGMGLRLAVLLGRRSSAIIMFFFVTVLISWPTFTPVFISNMCTSHERNQKVSMKQFVHRMRKIGGHEIADNYQTKNVP